MPIHGELNKGQKAIEPRPSFAVARHNRKVPPILYELENTFGVSYKPGRAGLPAARAGAREASCRPLRPRQHFVGLLLAN
jgi:hypothetical protein